MLNKNIKIFEFSSNTVTFVKNLIPEITEIKIKNSSGEETVVEVRVGKRKRAMIIGREGKNLKLYKNLLQRTHGVADLIVR